MKRSLGTVLVLGLSGLQFLAVLGVVLSSYLTSERALIAHARALIADVGHNAQIHSRSFLNPAKGAVTAAARLSRTSRGESRRLVGLEQLMFDQLHTSPQFSEMYFVAEDGLFLRVRRQLAPGDGFETLIIPAPGSGLPARRVIRGPDFAIRSEISERLREDDRRNRFWYRKTVDGSDMLWLRPYSCLAGNQTTISLTSPVRGADGVLQGMVGVNIRMNQLSDFLSELKFGQNGRMLIVDDEGHIIAHPDPMLMIGAGPGGGIRLPEIPELVDPVARAAFTAARSRQEAGRDQVVQFVHGGTRYNGGTRYIGMLTPLIGPGIPWSVIVYAPQDDFVRELKQNRRENIVLAVLLSLITACAGLLLAEYIHRPVRDLARMGARLDLVDLPDDTSQKRDFRELELTRQALARQARARRNREIEYGQTFDLAPRGMAQIGDGEMVLLHANQRLGDMLGVPPEQLRGRTIREFIHPLDDGTETCPMASGAAPGADSGLASDRLAREGIELRLVRADGCVIWASLHAIPVWDEQGRPLYNVLTLDDVTERRRIEQEVDRLNADLSHLARGATMGQMAAGLAHELNQPLTAIAQNAYTAKAMVDTSHLDRDMMRGLLHSIERQSLRAGEIIHALRGFIRKDTGQRAPVDLVPLVRQTLLLVQPEAMDAGVVIDVSLPIPLPPVLGNRVQIAQVLVNLLRNAIQAAAAKAQAKGGGRVHLGASVAPGLDRVCIEVADNGAGVPPDIALFSEFETSKPDGLGLGLSICRAIVEAHGGRIWHHSEGAGDLGGAVFRFDLPAMSSSPPPPPRNFRDLNGRIRSDPRQ
ncbi:MAG: cache domain-containing protein [Paracoccus sp. (in: a-proteobacteria)]|uniref:sensor histidine kinase n=1 Tax=Paracoccus sp. TaxID=267 RepID=UPI0039E362BA